MPTPSSCNPANPDLTTFSPIRTMSHGRAAASNNKRGCAEGGIRPNACSPRVNASADTPNIENPASHHATTTPLHSISDKYLEASSSKVTLDGAMGTPAQRMEGSNGGVHGLHRLVSSCSFSLPATYHQPKATGKGKERETNSAILPAVVNDDECPSEAETEVADNSLSTAATEIIPFSPQLPKRLNLPPRRIPTPPLPPVKTIDFAYRPKPSLEGLPERPIDPRWVVPRVPGSKGIRPMEEIKRRWVQQWEAAQDQPGGIYRTGRNRVDGTPNPPPVISAIVTQEGMRGYTSHGWVSPSLRTGAVRIPMVGRPRPHMKHSTGGHPKSQPQKREARTGRTRKGVTDQESCKSVSASLSRAPAPVLAHPVPRRMPATSPSKELGPQLLNHPIIAPSSDHIPSTSMSMEIDNSPSPGRKRRRAEAGLGTDTEDDARSGATEVSKAVHPRTGLDLEASTIHSRRKEKLRTRGKVGTKVKDDTTDKHAGKGKLASRVHSPPTSPRYSLRSRNVGRNGKG